MKHNYTFGLEDGLVADKLRDDSRAKAREHKVKRKMKKDVDLMYSIKYDN